MSHLRCTLAAAVLVLLGAAVPASADTPVATSADATPIAADAGWAAWRADDGRLVVRGGNGGANTTSLRPPASAPFDVGAKRGGGGAQVVWAERCSTRSRACTVRSAVLRAGATLTASVIGHISYRGGGSPAVAVNGSRLAYTLRAGGCDVPFVRTLPRGSARRLDRGRCADISQLDLTASHVGVLAHPAMRYGTGATEARVVGVGGGPSHTLQREAQGEESNFIGSIALDGDSLYTARAGIRQANIFTRWSLATRSRADARAFVDLEGGFSRDRGRTFYLQTENFEGVGDCRLAIIPIPGSPVPRRYLAAVTRPGGGGVSIPTNEQIYVQTYVHVSANATRLADGRLQITGAITPGQPGRKVRLDRRLDRICNGAATPSGSIPMPNQAGVPAGCLDRYTQDPVATASVSADGSTYTLIAPASAPAGTYSVSMDSPRGASVYAGQTAGFAAP